MKKHLSLLLAVLMLLSSVGFNAFAAAECQHKTAMSDPEYYEVKYPTCDEQGYTIYYCTKCGAEVTRVYSDSLGHVWGKEQYESNGKGDYRMFKTCTREYFDGTNTVVCGAKSIEMDGANEVLYHQVQFVNDKITKSYDSSISYTKVVDTYESKLLETTYVKHGEDAVFEGGTLIREKTKAFPLYHHIGWSETSFEATAAQTYPADYYANSVVTNVEKNMTLYPVFEGITSTTEGTIEHRVIFYIINENDQIEQGTRDQYVAHGETAKFSKPNGELYTVTKKEDLAYTYEHTGWKTSENDKNYIDKDTIESYPIYGNVGFTPVFDSIAKNYTVEFYKEELVNGSISYRTLFTYGSSNKKSVFNNVHLNENLLLQYSDKSSLGDFLGSTNLFSKNSDEEYIYIWTGDWAILRPDGTVGRVVDLQDFRIYEGEYRTEQNEDGSYVTYENGEIKKVIRLVPVYKKNRQVYAVKIKMHIPEYEDDAYYLAGADVHVTANNGQLVASGQTDGNGEFRCNLYYQIPFTVTVATADGKYLGTQMITTLNKVNGNLEDEIKANTILVGMSLNPDYETHCKCIHHNALLQPIVVRIFNILYGFFNVKYVCCYDMYSTIGPLLDYTA